MASLPTTDPPGANARSGTTAPTGAAVRPAPAGVQQSRPWAAPVGLAAAALTGCVALGLLEPGDNGPVLCPFREVTGLDCPGCGMTRAVAGVARGRIGTALDYNLFLVVLIPVLVYLWASWLAARLGRRLPPLRVGARGYAVAGVALAIFAVVRNLPFGVGRYLNSDPLAG
jgi:hypothetical protein